MENFDPDTNFTLDPRPFDPRLTHYPELYDKPHNGIPPEPIILTCTTSFIRGKCESGHQFAKALVCAKEWCSVCGKQNSDIHQRRIARWWSKAMTFEKFGYLVVTVPECLRFGFKDKQMLSDFRTYVKRKLQRMGYNKGLIRYHWAGDCDRCKGKGEFKNVVCQKCSGTGAGRKFHPHLNVIIEQGWLKKEDFDKVFTVFRNDLTKWFHRRFPVTSGQNKVVGNCFFTYATEDAHKIHKLKYITRATWRFYDKEICDLIKGFRTSSTWGKFEKSEEKRTSDLVAFESNECPCCGGKIAWKKEFIKVAVFKRMQYEHIQAGYFIFNSS